MLLISFSLTNYPSFTPSEECVSQRNQLAWSEHVSVPFSLQIDEGNLLNPRRRVPFSLQIDERNLLNPRRTASLQSTNRREELTQVKKTCTNLNLSCISRGFPH